MPTLLLVILIFNLCGYALLLLYLRSQTYEFDFEAEYARRRLIRAVLNSTLPIYSKE